MVIADLAFCIGDPAGLRPSPVGFVLSKPPYSACRVRHTGSTPVGTLADPRKLKASYMLDLSYSIEQRSGQWWAVFGRTQLGPFELGMAAGHAAEAEVTVRKKARHDDALAQENHLPSSR